MEEKLSSQFSELNGTTDRCVLVVHVLCHDASFRLLHTFQDKRLTVVVTVSAHTEVKLIRVWIIAPGDTFSGQYNLRCVLKHT